jgi:hypothetical protein
MTSLPSQEIVGKARRVFRAIFEKLNYLSCDDTGDAGWALFGYAQHQVELLDARLERLGVDTSQGLDPVYLLPHARLPVGDEQAMSLMRTVLEARRWRTIHYSGVRAYHIAIGGETLAAIVAAHCRRVPPVPLEAVGALVEKIGVYILQNMLYTWERCLVFEAGINMQEMPTKSLREVGRDILTAWARENIKLTGQEGGRLRRALGIEGFPHAQEEPLMCELPGAVTLAWKDMQPKEPLRSTGRRETSLVRRIARLMEDTGSEEAKRPGKLVHETFGVAATQEKEGRSTEHLGAADDELIEEFELRETLRQELGALREWVEKAKLSEQERQVYELDMQTDHDTRGIASKLDITEGHVRVVRRNYRGKIAAAAGL